MLMLDTQHIVLSKNKLKIESRIYQEFNLFNLQIYNEMFHEFFNLYEIYQNDI